MKKVMSAIYYRKVFERFDRRQNSTFNVKNSNQISTPTSASTMAPPPRKNKCFTKEENETNKKREVKIELKEPQKVVDSFILSKSKIGSRSADVYKQVCQDFLDFSGTIDCNDVSQFIRSKFKFDFSIKDDEITLKGTSLKYMCILEQLFKFIGERLDHKFKKEYYDKSVNRATLNSSLKSSLRFPYILSFYFLLWKIQIFLFYSIFFFIFSFC